VEEFKRYFNESYSLKKYFTKARKPYLLMTILGILYFQNPEEAVRLLGAIDSYERNGYFTPLEKRYYQRSMEYLHGVLPDPKFDFGFAEGKRMSLDEALELATKIIDEI
jgi:hypothetical protein